MAARSSFSVFDEQAVQLSRTTPAPRESLTQDFCLLEFWQVTFLKRARAPREKMISKLEFSGSDCQNGA
ncbi:hypothetical protein Pint_18898 [Pistacia integerrima]|uniref:Uncharacterized protein n=1 Tax=Pistacia integerrima TaxID=434235 RepID=A0ACC0Z0U9_9ROSI|nr:hypothetical protein Pint_18898 [Pistacia integerrima]